MRSLRFLLAFGLSVCVCTYFAGCAENGATKTSDVESEMMEEGHDHDHDHDHDDHAGHDHDSEIEVVLASLTPHEQELAKAQDMKCIVAGEPLGSMGRPKLVENVEGHDFLICCEGCESELRNHPEKYVAKLKDADVPAEQAPASEEGHAADPS